MGEARLVHIPPENLVYEMGALWGKEKKLTPKEMMKQSERAIKRSIRDLDKERANLEKHEKKMQGDIKKCVQKGQIVAARHIARDVVRTRNQITRTYRMSAQLQSVSNKLTSMKATHATTEVMDRVCKAMIMINKQFSMPALQQMAADYAREADQLEMMGEMTDEIIGDMLEDEDGDEDAAAEDILNSVLDAEGLKAADQYAAAPMGAPSADAPAATKPQMVPMGAGPGGPPPPGGGAGGGGGDADELSELQRRLASLRGEGEP